MTMIDDSTPGISALMNAEPGWLLYYDGAVHENALLTVTKVTRTMIVCGGIAFSRVDGILCRRNGFTISEKKPEDRGRVRVATPEDLSWCLHAQAEERLRRLREELLHLRLPTEALYEIEVGIKATLASACKKYPPIDDWDAYHKTSIASQWGASETESPDRVGSCEAQGGPSVESWL